MSFVVKTTAGGVDVNADNVLEWMNRDKGHWLTGADEVDVMNHAGISRL